MQHLDPGGQRGVHGGVLVQDKVRGLGRAVRVEELEAGADPGLGNNAAGLDVLLQLLGRCTVGVVGPDADLQYSPRGVDAIGLDTRPLPHPVCM